MSEEDPGFRLQLAGGKEFIATRDNSSLFRYFGQLAFYDHAYFLTMPEESRGLYIFSNHQQFLTIAKFMLDNDYPAHLNARDVAECDIEAFDKMIMREADHDLEAGVPEDWR